MRFWWSCCLLCLLLSFHGNAFSQGNLFSPDYLTGGSAETTADRLSFDEYVHSISFDAFLEALQTPPPATPELGTGTTEGGTDPHQPPSSQPPPSQPPSQPPAPDSPPPPTDEQDLSLLGVNVEGTDGATGHSPSMTPDSAYYWRAWGERGDLRENIHQGTFTTPEPINVDGEPWSYSFFPMDKCELAFARFPVVSVDSLTNAEHRSRGFHKLSPMEAYDTWVFNTTGRIPGAAALEAHTEFHNKAPLCVRRSSPDSEELAHFWIVSSRLRQSSQMPLALRLPDGNSLPARFTPEVGQSRTYRLSTQDTSHEVTARGRNDIDVYFPGRLVEEFIIPYDAVRHDDRFAIRGTDTRHRIYRIDEDGQFIRDEHGRLVTEGQLSWNDIQANEMLRRQHLRAKDPETISVYRLVEDDGSSLGWYYLEHTLKPGFQHYGWWGHCNGWAAASLRVPVPESFPIVHSFDEPIKLLRLRFDRAHETLDSAGRQQITMSLDDYEVIETTATTLSLRPAHYFGIATEIWQDCDTSVRNVNSAFYDDLSGLNPLGHRTWGDDRSSNEEYLNDIYPHHYFTLLMYHVKERREGMVVDVNRGYQVWNQPVRGFSYRHTWVPTPDDPINLGFYDLTLNIDYVPYGGLWDDDDPGRYSVRSDGKPYRARLLVDDLGRVYRGEWIDADGINSTQDHPDFAWLPISHVTNHRRSQNYFVDNQAAMRFLNLAND